MKVFELIELLKRQPQNLDVRYFYPYVTDKHEHDEIMSDTVEYVRKEELQEYGEFIALR